MSSNTNDDVRVFTSAVEAGIWGLVLKAMGHEEGSGAAAALLANVQAGRADVECLVRFHSGGVVHEAFYASHGTRSHLFTINITHPGNPDAQPESAA